MQKKIQIFMKQYHMIEENDHVVVGVSGGADSVCLLDLLCHLQKEMHFALTAVHVEHGIRGNESLSDAAFVEQLCETWQVPLLSYSVDAIGQAHRAHQTLEEAARNLRYDCFYQACRQVGAKCLAVAHHGDDCAETVLFHLSRGTGLRGLCGIVPVRRIEPEGITLIRPLLCVNREEIEHYLTDRNQPYRIDSTNADEAMSRNKIRSQVLPQLQEINSAAATHIVRTAGYLEEICEYLDDAAWAAGNAYVKYRNEKSRIVEIDLERQGFLTLPAVLQKNLIHRLLGELAGSKKDLTAAHMEAVQGLLYAQVGKRISLPCGMQAEAEYERICLRRKQEERPETVRETCELPVPGKMLLESGMFITTRILEFDGNFQQIPEKTCTKWFDYDKIKNTVQIRTRRPGDFLQVHAEGGHKKLKDYLINSKVPQKERDQLLLLADGNHIMWIIGRRISEAYKVTQKTKHILEVCVNGGKENNE